MKNILCFFVIFFLSNAARADGKNQTCESHVPSVAKLGKVSKLICTYEPNTVGFTKDSDDRIFMDFKLSVRTQLFPGTFTEWFGSSSAVYFAYTGRLAQYIGTRDSSPVVGKRFNPKLFYRYWYNECHGDEGCPDNYFDFGYAHESNGQSINSQAALDAAKNAELSKPNGRVDFAYDNMSRGWDYLEAKWKSEELIDKSRESPDGIKTRFDFDLSAYADIKYFLKNGLLQGKPEEFDSTWETDREGKLRRQVDGLNLMAKGIVYVNSSEAIKYAFSLTTGYVKPFQYNTVRLELGVKPKDWLPLVLWYQKGYNSDLAQYYKRVHSFGVNVELGSF